MTRQLPVRVLCLVVMSGVIPQVVSGFNGSMMKRWTLLVAVLLVTLLPVATWAELPQNVTVVLDSSERIDVDVGDPAQQWPGLPARAVYRIEFNNDRLRCTGSDFWVYTQGPNVLVFGCRKLAQDAGFLDPPDNTMPNPNFVPESFTEIVWDRRPAIQPLVRYPAGIPPAALTSLKRWRY